MHYARDGGLRAPLVLLSDKNRLGEETVARTTSRLEQADRLAHRRLDVQRLDVLPVLLEQGDEEVDAWKNSGVNVTLHWPLDRISEGKPTGTETHSA